MTQNYHQQTEPLATGLFDLCKYWWILLEIAAKQVHRQLLAMSSSFGSESETALTGPFDNNERVRKVRIHKKTRQAFPADASDIDRSIAEIIPGLADLSLAGPSNAAAMRTASSIRQQLTSREESRRQQMAELSNIFDMSVPHPVDNKRPDPSQPFDQKLRPTPQRIQLSHYQLEMINYQRMLLRKNIWYYRDRLNNPRYVYLAYT